MRPPRRRPTARGAVAVEFGLVMVPLLLLVFGIIQYGLYLWAMQAGSNAAGEAVRRLTVGDCRDPAALTTMLGNRLGLATSDASAVTATVVYKAAASDTPVSGTAAVVGDTVDLTVRYPVVDLHLPLVPMPDGGNVTRHVFGRLEDTTPSANGCR